MATVQADIDNLLHWYKIYFQASTLKVKYFIPKGSPFYYADTEIVYTPDQWSYSTKDVTYDAADVFQHPGESVFEPLKHCYIFKLNVGPIGQFGKRFWNGYNKMYLAYNAEIVNIQ